MRRYCSCTVDTRVGKGVRAPRTEAVRVSFARMPAVKTTVANTVAQGSKLLEDGCCGLDAIDHILRSLCRGLRKANPAAVMQTLQNLVVPQGTPFPVLLGELRLLVSCVRCVGQVAPEDDTMQLAIKTSIDDESASLSAQIVAGRDLRPVPLDNVDDMFSALDDLSLNQTAGCVSSPQNGGGGR